MTDAHEITRLEAISYNYLAGEYQNHRRESLARPEATMRAILSAPFYAAADTINGKAGASHPSGGGDDPAASDPPAGQSNTGTPAGADHSAGGPGATNNPQTLLEAYRFAAANDSGYSARYHVGLDYPPENELTASLRIDAPLYLLAPPARHRDAYNLVWAATNASDAAVPLREHLLHYVDAAANEDPMPCPTYRLSAPPSPPPPPAPAPSHDGEDKPDADTGGASGAGHRPQQSGAGAPH